jgi:hypothetical protein
MSGAASALVNTSCHCITLAAASTVDCHLRCYFACIVMMYVGAHAVIKGVLEESGKR